MIPLRPLDCRNLLPITPAWAAIRIFETQPQYETHVSEGPRKTPDYQTEWWYFHR